MKIFAIKDRMLDYFQVPVVVHREQDLIAAIARGINGKGEEQNELAQAPDHYELWELGEVDDQGHIVVTRIFRANCASFIRNGVWKRGASDASAPENAAAGRNASPAAPDSSAGTKGRPLQGAPQAAAGSVQATHPESGSGNPASDR